MKVKSWNPIKWDAHGGIRIFEKRIVIWRVDGLIKLSHSLKKMLAYIGAPCKELRLLSGRCTCSWLLIDSFTFYVKSWKSYRVSARTLVKSLTDQYIRVKSWKFYLVSALELALHLSGNHPDVKSWKLYRVAAQTEIEGILSTVGSCEELKPYWVGTRALDRKTIGCRCM